MKIIIESTPDVSLVDGYRVWRGSTPDGLQVHAVIKSLSVHAASGDEEGQRALDAAVFGLIELQQGTGPDRRVQRRVR